MKQKRAKWELTQKLVNMLQALHERWLHASILIYWVSNKPIIPRLKRDDIGINVTPTVHANAVITSPGVLISTSAKHRRERAVRNISIFCYLSL